MTSNLTKTVINRNYDKFRKLIKKSSFIDKYEALFVTITFSFDIKFTLFLIKNTDLNHIVCNNTLIDFSMYAINNTFKQLLKYDSRLFIQTTRYKVSCIMT